MNDDSWTVRRMLRWMTDDFSRLGISTPRLDAELLVAHSLGFKRVQLYLDLDRPLSDDELLAIRAHVKRRRQYEPIAYILGQREFYGRSFLVDARVLVPRPDTEILVDEALACLPADADAVRALDLCTGSGCIGLTLLAEKPSLRVDLTDLSAEALVLAKVNAERLGVVARATLYQGDLLAALPAGVSYQVIACNPPYIAEREWSTLQADVREHEPRIALIAEEDGLAFYRRLTRDASSFLAKSGTMLLEVGQGQADLVMAMCRAAGFEHVTSVRDLSGIARVVRASQVPSSQSRGEVTLDEQAN